MLKIKWKDLRKSALAALRLLAVLQSWQQRRALPARFCVSPEWKVRVAMGCALITAFPLPVFSATIDQLVAKQRAVMAQALDEKLKKTDASVSPAPHSPNTAALPTEGARTSAQNLRIHAIYGVGEQVTVDVSIGNGPSFPLTKGRTIDGWSLTSIAPTSVTLKHVNGRKKTVYLSTPAHVDAEASQGNIALPSLPPNGMAGFPMMPTSAMHGPK